MSVCENCAAEDEELTPVWPLDEPRAAQAQLWCPQCVERHAHEPADEDETEEIGEA